MRESISASLERKGVRFLFNWTNCFMTAARGASEGKPIGEMRAGEIRAPALSFCTKATRHDPGRFFHECNEERKTAR